jgi:hypothetical protein
MLTNFKDGFTETALYLLQSAKQGMIGIPKPKYPSNNISPFSPRRAGVWIVLTFLMVFDGGSVVGQNPVYNHSDNKDLEFINVKFADVLNLQSKLNRVIISVDVNSQEEIFVLTFGNGIKRVSDTGGLIDFIPNQNDRLSNSLDFAINSEGKFFVATNESNRRFIRVYSPTGVYLPDETLGDGTYGTGPNKFRGPTGLTFDKDDNLYVADHYIGTANPPPTNPSFIKVYRKDFSGNYKNNLIKEFDRIQGTLLNFPYRLAVNSQGHLYMTESGQDGNTKVKILQFDAGFNPTQIGEITGAASQIGSPGSIIIDKFDYIFVTDFGPKVKMTTILEAANDPFKLIAIFDDLKEGIANNVFKINIYNPDRSYFGSITNEIDLAVDMAIDNCGKLYVNNTILSGKTGSPPFYFAMDANLDFDLEIYQRSPGYDTEDPTITCPSNRTETVTIGQTGKIVNYTLPVFNDNCPGSSMVQTSGLASGSNFPIGITTNTFVVTDASGRTADCSFTVTITADSDTEAPVITCPADLTKNVDPGACGAIVNYATPTATDNSGSSTISIKSGPSSGSLFPVGLTTVTFEATDTVGNNAECSFTITVNDNQNPTIVCPSNSTETVAIGQTGKVVNYALPVFNDNCPGSSMVQTSGLASGSNFPLGITTNTFVVTDASGRTADCSFIVTITADSDTEAPVITCPADLTKNVDPGVCGAIVNYATPTATDNSGSSTISLKSGTSSGSLFPVGITTVTFEATDAAGNKAECSFTVTVLDNENPTIACPSNKTETVTIGQTGKVVNYALPVFNDNCPGSSMVQTSGLASGSNFPLGITTNTFVVTDASGRTADCSFTVTITADSDTEAPVINCPADLTKNVDPKVCGAIVNYATPTATDNSGSATITLKSGPASGSLFPVGLTTLTFEATDPAGNKAECSISVTVSGSCIEIPEANFPYISIYPNPTPGPFTFDTPNGWRIEKVEVFDARGRYVLTETYSENEFEYSMDLSGLQESVYFLKLYTSQGIKILRVIINW